MKVPVAAQVYSVREEAAADFEKTMQQLADMGYDGVELAGLYGKSVEEIRNCLKRVGLQAVSAHVPIDELKMDMDKTVQIYQEIGCKYGRSLLESRKVVWWKPISGNPSVDGKNF